MSSILPCGGSVIIHVDTLSLRPVYTTKRFVPISGGAGFKPFSRVHTGIIMNRFHVTRTRANSLIYHVSLPNNRVNLIYSGLQLPDNGVDSSCSCVLLSLFFSLFYIIAQRRRERELLRGRGCTCVE